MAKIAFTGIDYIDRRLRALGPAVANKVVVKAMRQAMKPLQPAVANAAPEGETGHLKQAVKVRAGRRQRNKKSIIVYIDADTLKAEPGADGKPPFYAVAQEYGTRKMPGKGFMRKAFDANKEHARTEAETLMRDAIEDLIKTL